MKLGLFIGGKYRRNCVNYDTAESLFIVRYNEGTFPCEPAVKALALYAVQSSVLLTVIQNVEQCGDMV